MIENTTITRDHYDRHAQLRAYLHLFVDDHNHDRGHKTLYGLTPTEFILDA